MLQGKPHGTTKNQLQHTGSPVSSLFWDRAKEVQEQDGCREGSDNPNQSDSVPFQPVPLPAFIGVFCASDLNTTGEIQERFEISIGIAHSDADESFPLVVLDELEGGSPLFPLLD